MYFTFTTEKTFMDKYGKLDKILRDLDNKMIASEIALNYFCGYRDYDAIPLYNIESEKVLESDIKNVLDTFRKYNLHIIFSVERVEGDRLLSRDYYDSQKGLISEEELKKLNI